MTNTARWTRQLVVLGSVLACEATQTPPSGVVAPAASERAAAGAAALLPGGGAPNEPAGIGGSAPEPSRSGPDGLGGNDTGSGGSAAGAAGTSDGSSGRDGDPRDPDEQRYAILFATPPPGK